MAQTKANTTSAKPAVGGAVSIGALTATLPTSATSTLSDFSSLGYISEDGIINSNSPDVTEHKAYNGDVVLREYERPDTFKLKLIEALNPDVLKVVYGDTKVTGTTSITVAVAPEYELEAHPYVIDQIMNGGKLQRITIPSGRVTAVGDIVYKQGEIVSFDVTITADKDSSGNTHYTYIDTPSTASTTATE